MSYYMTSRITLEYIGNKVYEVLKHQAEAIKRLALDDIRARIEP
jgi:hypothetical protein